MNYKAITKSAWVDETMKILELVKENNILSNLKNYVVEKNEI